MAVPHGFSVTPQERGHCDAKVNKIDPGLFQFDSKSPAWAYGYGPFDFADPSLPPAMWNGTGKGYPTACNAKIATYVCPSDPGVRAPYVLDGFILQVRSPPLVWGWGWDWVLNIPGYGAELGRTNYLGVGGGYGKVWPEDPIHQPWAPFTGIYHMNSRTKAADIKDGLSNTLAFGEALGGLHIDGTRDMELSWMGAGWSLTKDGLAPVYGPKSNDYYFRMFQSNHTRGIVNCAWADGHVSGISQGANFNAFIFASGKADGQVFDPAASGLDF